MHFMDERAHVILLLIHINVNTFTIGEYEKIASRLEKAWVIERSFLSRFFWFLMHI